MRTLLFSSVLALVFALGMSQASYAFCTFVGPNGGGNILDCPAPVQLVPLTAASTPPNNTTTDDDIVSVPLGGGIIMNPPGLLAMETDEGNDMVTVGGEIINDGGLIGLSTSFLGLGPDSDTVIINPGADILGATGLVTGIGADMVTMNGGSVVGNVTAGMFTGPGPDTVVINDGEVGGGFILSISTGLGSDMLTVNGGNFNGPIEMFSGSDIAILNGGTYNFFTIDMSFGMDTIHITNNIPDIGVMLCGFEFVGPDIDTLIMSMQVPADQVQALTTEFLNAGDNGSIVVNGITYTWVDCENRIANFNGVVTTIALSPIGATNPISTDHTVTADVTVSTGENEGLLVDFSVSSGPNAGADSGSEGTCSPNPDCTTDSNGQVSWTYTSNGLIGTDTIVASIDDQFIGMSTSNTVEKLWIFVRNVPTLGEWGLIAMAVLLGIVGFMVIRKKQLTA